MPNENVSTVIDALRTLDTVMLTTVDASFQLVSRPMALQVDRLDDGVLDLFAPKDSRAVADITACPSVNVSHTSPALSISLAGTASVVDDAYEVALRWHGGLGKWFPYGRGGAVLVRVTILEGRCWRLPERETSERQLTA